MTAVLLDTARRLACSGLKGPRAGDWLGAQGIEVPATANSWVRASAGGAPASVLVARLGTSEYFLEELIETPRINRLLDAPPPGVYPVLREDRAVELSGPDVHEVLAQVCNVEFAALERSARPLVMTLMLGVAVLVIVGGGAADPTYRIWCDPTYAPALFGELEVVVKENGGCVRGEIQGVAA
jgi:sarcosine oxidase subunit gamma